MTAFSDIALTFLHWQFQLLDEQYFVTTAPTDTALIDGTGISVPAGI